MSVPTIEELVETFERAHRDACGFGAQPEGVRPALLAVLDRLKPVVADAFRAGGHVGFENDYATRIIEQIKGAEQ